jgi:hypothetical protein
MFCPQCQAEYRQGFTVCADCEVPLVVEILPTSDSPARTSIAGPLTEPCVVWKGTDQARCVSLCLRLRSAAIAYAVAQKMQSRDEQMRVVWTYELSVSASDESRAQQLLDLPEIDAAEDNPDQEAEEDSSTTEDGFPAYSTDENEEDPFCGFWEGDDARICAEICDVLDEASIPHRVLRREANLFRLSPRSQMKIGVPFSLYQKAEQVVVEAFGGAEERHTLPWPAGEDQPKPRD